MNLDRRLGNQDGDAAALFAAARSFRPSARGRRRALRALGLPIGLSLLGSGLAHAASVLSTSLKGWGLVAGVVASVGAAGGVTYVVTRAASDPPSVRHPASPKHATTSGRAATSATNATNATGASLREVPQVPAVSTAAPPDTAPEPVAAPPLPGPVAGVVPRLAMRAQPRPVPRAPLDPGDDAPPPAPPSAPVERPPVPVAPPPFVAPRIAPAQVMTSGPSSLNGELALVSDAQARLRAGDARGALVALDLHGRLYPHGALAEEVELLRLRALIARGDARGARQSGDAFLQHHPLSPLGARVRSLMTALAEPEKP